MPKNRDLLPWFGVLAVFILFGSSVISLDDGFGGLAFVLFWAAFAMLIATVSGFYTAGAYDYTRSTDIKPGEYPVMALWRVHLVTHIVLKHGEAIDGWYRIYEIQSDLLPPDLKEGDMLVVQREKLKGRTYVTYRISKPPQHIGSSESA